MQLDRMRTFFRERVWEVDLDQLPRWRAFAFRVARAVVAAVRTFNDRDVASRAAALTFYTVLSVVPLLALAFSTIKALGDEEQLNQRLLPFIRESFAGNPQLVTVAESVITLVQGTNVGGLGAAGLVMIIYTSVILLSEASQAMNAIWGAPDRSLMRRITDFVALIVLAPVGLTLLISAIATITAGSMAFQQYARETLHLGFVVDLMLIAAPLLLIFVGLVVVYIVLPNTRVRPVAAIVGALVGTLFWYGTLLALARFQVGVAKYNVLYAGFAAIPIFLFWMYVSWIGVLVGGIVAANHQYSRLVAERMRSDDVDQAFREAIALEATGQIARAFLQPEAKPRPWTVSKLAGALQVPSRVLQNVLVPLQGAGYLVRTEDDPDAPVLMARDPGSFRVKDVLDALRHTTHETTSGYRIEHGRSPRVRTLLREMDQALEASPLNESLRDFAVRAELKEPTAEEEVA